LQALPNVKLLGQQAYETMPQYLYHFAACMIPFKVNPITEATDDTWRIEYARESLPRVVVYLDSRSGNLLYLHEVPKP